MKNLFNLITATILLFSVLVSCKKNESVQSVWISQKTLTLEVGKMATLTATIMPKNATNKTVQWESNNNDVATVNNSGMVTALTEGKTLIAVTTQDGNRKSYCFVTVKDTLPPFEPKPIEPEMVFRVFDEFDDEMIEKHPDGSFMVNVTWDEDNWIYGFLLSFGEYIEVLEPEHVKKILKKKAEKILQKYL